MESSKKRKRNKQCGYQGPGQETPCEISQQWRGPNNSHYCQKHYNQSLQHQQGMEQPRSTIPVDGHIIISESSSIWKDELHLNQATAQPHSKNPVDATTNNNGGPEGRHNSLPQQQCALRRILLVRYELIASRSLC